ncbi:MAG: O-antigen ligase family protein [Clostridia bacterium]|nr:O-antigen ligase family protein [Clostridia bacterium]
MNKNNFLYNSCKAIFALYVLYSQFFKYIFTSIPRLSQILIIASFLLLIIYKKKIVIYKEMIWFAVFSALILAASFFSHDSSIALTYSELIVEYFIMVYVLISISELDGSVRFVSVLFVLLGVMMGIWMILFGTGINRISISEGVNVNIVGTVLAFSIGFILFLLMTGKRTTFTVVLSVVLILFLMFSVLSTASKKCLIAAVALIIGFVIFCYKYLFKKIPPVYVFLTTAFIVAVSVIAFAIISARYGDRLLYAQARMDDILVDDSTQKRYALILEGFSVFLKNPVLGVGINNFRYYSTYTTYSHCTYAELLACTGVVGTLLFAVPCITSLRDTIGAVRTKAKKTLQRSSAIYMLVIFIVMLFVCWTQIIIYTPCLMYVLGTMMAYNYVEKNNGKTAADPDGDPAVITES